MKWRPDTELTDRELEYAELLAWGGARKEVAEKLGVTLSTVENTTRTIYRKLGIQKATELSVWWFVTRLRVPISLDPWKRAVVSLFLLMVILPRELYANGDAFRRAESRVRITRTVTRSGKGKEDTTTL